MKDPAAVALGRKGGLKGGPASILARSTTEHAEISSRGGRNAWAALTEDERRARLEKAWAGRRKAAKKAAAEKRKAAKAKPGAARKARTPRAPRSA